MAKRGKKKRASQSNAATVAKADPLPASPHPLLKRRSTEQRPNLADLALMLRIALILTVGTWIYWPALNGDWLWDDRNLVRDNALLHDPAGLWKIWFDPMSLYDYLPLKISFEWIEMQLWGNEVLGYHLVNLGLHLISAFLLWRFLAKFGLKHAWLGGLIFTVHPILVESVAWISEIKNTLSLPFFLLAMSTWIDFEAKGRARHYVLTLVLFALAMLAKPTMIMFPVVILLYAWWRRVRFGWRDVAISAPFFVLSLAMGLTTIWFLHRGMSDQQVVLGGISSRLATAALTISFYFGKCFLPVDLMTIYPRWIIDPPSPEQFFPWPVLGGVVYFLWTKRLTWGRHALLGLGFFLINLAPFLGLNAGSYMKYTWVMDHILYIPIIGLIGLTVAALGEIEAQLSEVGRAITGAFVAVALALMAWSSHSYAGIYVDLEALWTNNIERNPSASLPHNDLGVYLSENGRMSEAREQLRLAVALHPSFADAHHNYGILLIKTGDGPGAETEFNALLRMNLFVAESHYHLGLAKDLEGKIDAAMDEYRRAIGVDPHYMGAYNNLAVDLITEKRFDEGVAIFRAGLRVNPNDPNLQSNLAKELEMQRKAAAPQPPRGQLERQP